MSDEARIDDDAPAVADAARAIALGDAVDWRTLESSAGDDASREVLRALEGVASIANFHQNWQAPPVPTPLELPSAWGTLTIVREIGRGSFGRVYLARDPRLNREVALKILNDHLVSGTPDGSAVLEEGRRLARLHHPNIVSIHGAQLVDGSVGLEMELVTGRTLAAIVRTDGPLGADEALLVGRDVCRALAAVHGAGLVHRDVKAQNVIREQGGRIVLMDFGAGRSIDGLGLPGMAGTPLYLAPEVLAGAPSTPQSDLYSLGALLFYLVTGTFPVEGGTIEELRAAHHQARLKRLRDVRPDLPEPFIQVVERALAADCRERVESAGRFEAELSGVLAQIDHGHKQASRARRRAIAAAGVVVLAVALMMTWQRARPASERIEPAAPVGRSIAVLPFVNRSGSAEDDYFADGMTDELIAALGKVPGLQVAARTSAFSFKGRSIAVREVAGELGVESVLEGTVRRSGRRLRVTASLVSASDGLQHWSSTFENADGDAFAVQDEITRGVVSELSLRLGGMALLASQAGRTKDPEAHDLYLRGLALASAGSEADLRRALELYQQAIARDPGFALAYTGIAVVHTMLADAYVPPNQAYQSARAAAAAAIERDDLVANAHAVLGYAGFGVDWDLAAAEREYRRALEIDPNAVTALLFFGTHLCGVGRPDEADLYLHRATQVDPLSPFTSWVGEWCGYVSQRHAAVIEAHKRTQAIAPGFWYLDSLVGVAHRELGDYPAAIREFEVAASRLGGAPQYGLAITYARMGRMKEAREIARRLDDLATRQYVPFLHRAAVRGAVGDMDAGVALLQQSLDARELLLVGTPRKPELAALLTDPRAQRILEQADAIWKRR